MLAACTPEPEPTVSEWLGPDLHGQMRGEIDGEPVNVVAQADEVACQRKYLVPDPNDPTTFADGHLDALQVSFMVKTDGIERWYELEFYNHDFATTALGTVLTVVPEPAEETVIRADQVNAELRWEWEQGNDLITYGETATGGMLELRELSGTAGADGLVIPAEDGNFGAFLQLELPDGTVGVSFTAICSMVEVETI
jgi:hypothetical protein